MATNIQVAVRVRPFLPFEAGAKSCIDVLPGEDDNQASSHQKLSQGKSVRIVSFITMLSALLKYALRDATNMNSYFYLLLFL